MFEKYTDLYFEMTNKSEKDINQIDESFYKVLIKEDNKCCFL